MIEYSDFIFCNKLEAIACSYYFHEELGIEHSDEDSLSNLSKIANGITSYQNQFKLEDRVRPRIMIITNSSEPVVVSIGPFRDHKICRFTQDTIDIDKNKLVDSNSAGDSFVGGFFAQIILMCEQKQQEGTVGNLVFSTEELQQAINAGNIMALQVLQRYGCTFPDTEEVRKAINDNRFVQG